MPRILGAVVVVGLMLGAVMPPPASAAAYAAYEGYESEFVTRINQLRAERGLNSLTVHRGLVTPARQWAAELAGRDTVAHHPDLASTAPEPWLRLGENVGAGVTVAELHERFVESEPHLRNLIQPDFTHVGIGVALGRDDALFVTQRFMTAKPPAPSPRPLPPPRVPRVVAESPSEPPTPSVPPPPPRATAVLELLGAFRGPNLRQ